MSGFQNINDYEVKFMRHIQFVLTLLVVHLFLVSYAVADLSDSSKSQPKWMETKTKELVDKARAATVQVPIQELKQLLDDDEDVIVFDVRTPKEYEVAHIPGSINISRGLLEFAVWSVVPEQNEKIYVYCKSGARAALATKQLNELGYKNAVSITTGAVDWAKSGYPMQTSITDEQIIILPVLDN